MIATMEVKSPSDKVTVTISDPKGKQLVKKEKESVMRHDFTA